MPSLNTESFHVFIAPKVTAAQAQPSPPDPKMLEAAAGLIGAVVGILGTISLYGIRVAVLRRDVNAFAAEGKRSSARITRIEHTLSRLDGDFEPYDTPV